MNDRRLVVITGQSGSGKSCAARALEDEGFFVVDNLPVSLLPRFLEDAARHSPEQPTPLAVVIDVRNRQYLANLDAMLARVRDAGYVLEIIFFDTSDEVLLRRYSETRRRHPLAKTDQVIDAVRLERQLLAGLRDNATRLVDTSFLTPHQLRQQVIQLLCGSGAEARLSVLLQSFGFRYGIPPASDLVIDVRFLPNPHYVPELQQLTGQQPEVQAFVLQTPVCSSFVKHLEDLLQFLLPQYRQEGKSYLTLSIGCTGGRHRSVAVVERLKQTLLQQEGVGLEVVHRDVAKR